MPKAVKDLSPYEKSVLLNDPQTPIETIREIFQDNLTGPGIKMDYARTASNENMLKLLSFDSNPDIRKAVGYNEETPIAIRSLWSP